MINFSSWNFCFMIMNLTWDFKNSVHTLSINARSCTCYMLARHSNIVSWLLWALSCSISMEVLIRQFARPPQNPVVPSPKFSEAQKFFSKERILWNKSFWKPHSCYLTSQSVLSFFGSHKPNQKFRLTIIVAVDCYKVLFILNLMLCDMRQTFMLLSGFCISKAAWNNHQPQRFSQNPYRLLFNANICRHRLGEAHSSLITEKGKDFFG